MNGPAWRPQLQKLRSCAVVSRFVSKKFLYGNPSLLYSTRDGVTCHPSSRCRRHRKTSLLPNLSGQEGKGLHISFFLGLRAVNFQICGGQLAGRNG